MNKIKEIAAITLFGASLTLFMYCNRDKDKREIIKQATDARELTSVIYKDGKDTLAIDYLTPEEFNRLTK